MVVEYKELLNFTKKILKINGVDDFSVTSVSNGLCNASLRGIDSHGIRLLPHYVNSVNNGRKNGNPDFKFELNFPSIGCLDADDAFGLAAGDKAMEYGMDIADKQGFAFVAVKNSSHPGAMSSIAIPVAEKGYIAFAFTHADSLILSHNGVRPYFGTNPICVAAPRVEGTPFCLDMATSVIPWNKLKMHRSNKKPLPKGVAADINGIETTDASIATSLLPTGGYKGFGLASVVEILCGIYTGMEFGRSIPSMFEAPIDQTRKLGQAYFVLKTDGVISSEDFIKRMQQMSNEVRSEPSDNDSVMLSGDKEILTCNERTKTGIPLDELTATELMQLGKKYDINLLIS